MRLEFPKPQDTNHYVQSIQPEEPALQEISLDIIIPEHNVARPVSESIAAMVQAEAPPTGISSLPIELLSVIFEFCWLSSPFTPTTSRFELIAQQVCSHWRDVSLSTPRIWSAIRIPPFYTLDSLNVYLTRSKSHTLGIGIYDLDHRTLRAAMDLLIPHSKRWRAFYVKSERSGVTDSLLANLSALAFPILEYVDVSPYGHPWDRYVGHRQLFAGGAPLISCMCLDGAGAWYHWPFTNITTLHLHGADTQTRKQSERTLTSVRFFELLRNVAHSLVNLCVHTNFRSTRDQQVNSPNTIHLPVLRRVRIHDVRGEYTWENTSYILLALDAPVLQSLALVNSTDDSLAPLFNRTTQPLPLPSLTSLTLHNVLFQRESTYISLHKAMPTVHHLEVAYLDRYAHEYHFAVLLRALGRMPPSSRLSSPIAQPIWLDLKLVTLKLTGSYPRVMPLLTEAKAGMAVTRCPVVFSHCVVAYDQASRLQERQMLTEDVVYRHVSPTWEEDARCFILT